MVYAHTCMCRRECISRGWLTLILLANLSMVDTGGTHAGLVQNAHSLHTERLHLDRELVRVDDRGEVSWSVAGVGVLPALVTVV